MTKWTKLIAGAGLLPVGCGHEIVALQPDEEVDVLGVESTPSSLGGLSSPVGGVEDAESPPRAAESGEPRPGLRDSIPRAGVEYFPGVLVPDSLRSRAPRCDKIDFLFVIDNSRSMRSLQLALIRSFEGFIGGVRKDLDIRDFHIMAVDTDDSSLRERLDLLSGGRCDVQLGAGRRVDKDGVDCGILGGRRYLLDDQPDLEGTFSCVAEVGTRGEVRERPVEAMLSALSPELNDQGGCNEGFLRDDALLVVTIITDGDDERSDDGPQQWADALLAVKGGEESSIVLLGLVGDEADDDECESRDEGPAPRVEKFVSSFSHGLFEHTCEQDYSPFFRQALGYVDPACTQFESDGLQ